MASKAKPAKKGSKSRPSTTAGGDDGSPKADPVTNETVEALKKQLALVNRSLNTARLRIQNM